MELEEWDRQMAERERKLERLERDIEGPERGSGRPKGPERGKRKGRRIIVMIALAVLALCAVVFTVVFGLMAADRGSPAMAEEVIQAVIDQDVRSAYGLMYPGAVSRADFSSGFSDMCRVWTSQGGGDTFELRRTSWSMDSSNGFTKYTTRFTVISGGARFEFTLIRAEGDGGAGMVWAQLVPEGAQTGDTAQELLYAGDERLADHTP